jgi:hypothetical protein
MSWTGPRLYHRSELRMSARQRKHFFNGPTWTKEAASMSAKPGTLEFLQETLTHGITELNKLRAKPPVDPNAHDCPRRSVDARGIPMIRPSVKCETCRDISKRKHAHLVKYIPNLRGWLEMGEAMDRDTEQALYEYYFEEMDYGTMTGDTGTFDEWINDRPEYIEELIARLEDYFPEAANPKSGAV